MAEGAVRYAEDYKTGEVFDLGYHDITKEEIVEFAKRYDPQPFHVDEEAARSTIFGGLVASGWHTGLILMRLMQQGFICKETSMGSPGHDELRFLQPVRPGDRLHGRLEVGQIRVSKSRPEIAFVNTTATLTNQKGEVVIRMKSAAIFKTRASAKKTPQSPT